MIRSAFVLQLLLSGVAAFAPIMFSSIHRYQSAGTEMNQMFPSASGSGLEVVEETGSPFDNYKPTDEQKEIAIKDINMGSGYTVGAVDNQLLEIKFTSKFVGGKFTANIKEFDVPSMVFKTGEQRCLPGLEEGIQGMKVGGKRSVRVPPSKGYGDRWYRGVVPPNSHLEFDVELILIAQSPVEEFQIKLKQFGYERAIGASVCMGYLVLSPFIHF